MPRSAKEIKVVSEKAARQTLHTLQLAELGKRARAVFHDLSNHLTALTLSVESLEENLARDSRQLGLKELDTHSKHSERTRIHMQYVAGLLRSHLAHIQQTQQTHFDPRPEIQKIIAVFSDRCVRDKVTIDFNSHAEKARILGNTNNFAHIVTNILSNAFDSFQIQRSPTKLTQARQTAMQRIEINLKLTSGHIALSISDTGCGISRANLSNIFKPGFTTKQNGHGIGLSAVKECVEKHFNGKISVESSKHGTTFCVMIPVQPIPQTPENTEVYCAKTLNDFEITVPFEVKGTSIL